MRRSTTTLAGLVLVGVLLTLSAAVALAVHDLDLFELDGNAVNDSGIDLPDDWQNVYDETDSALVSRFIEDDDSPDDITYFDTGGSKDVNDISEWRWSTGDVAPDKDEILHAFAAEYEYPPPEDGDPNLIVYFGADRYANNGTAQIGFWFFQNPVTRNEDGTFSGEHRNGDILILSDFVKGGEVPSINVYEWVGSGGSDGSLELLYKDPDADCNGDGDVACAIVNDKSEIAPWSYESKFPDKKWTESEFHFPAGTLFEGGINVTQLLPEPDNFCSFLAETRSSSSVDAQLKDFALGQIGECEEASIAITPPSDANQVGTEHELTVTVNSPDPVEGASVTAHLENTDGADATFVDGENTCETGSDGTCTVRITSSSTGLTSVWAEALGVTTDPPATKRWVDAQLTLEPTGTPVNQVGDEHLMTATLVFTDGSQSYPAPGQEISFSTDFGTLSDDSCTTDANGQCSVILTSDEAGLSTVSADWTGDVSTGEGTALDVVAPTATASKQWVDAQVTLVPDAAANEIGSEHVISATLTYTDGVTTFPIQDERINFTLSGKGTFVGDDFCDTDGLGRCSVTISSDEPGTTTITGRWEGEIVVEGVTTFVVAEGDATKQWVKALMTLEPPTAATQVGNTHTISATLAYSDGVTISPISTTVPINFSIEGVGGFVNVPTCVPGADGFCTVDIESPEDTGLTTAHAEWEGQIDLPDNLSATASATATARNLWVDALLTLEPELSISRVGGEHTISATLSFDCGGQGCFTNVPTITFSIESGPGDFKNGDNECVTGEGGNPPGSCTVTLQSTVEGTTTVRGNWAGNIYSPLFGTAPASLTDTAQVAWWDIRASFVLGPEDCYADPIVAPYEVNLSVSDIMPLTKTHELTETYELLPAVRHSRLCDDRDADLWWLDVDQASIISAELTTNGQADYDLLILVGDEDGNVECNTTECLRDALRVATDLSNVDSAGRMASGRMASGRMASGRMASGRMASGRMASGRMASGRMASGRMASGRMASGSLNDGPVDELAVTPVEGGRKVYVAVFSYGGAYGPEYKLTVDVEPTDIGECNWPYQDEAAAEIYGGSDGAPDTLILTHQGRLQAIYGIDETNALISKLHQLADAVDGVVVPVELDPDVATAYATWNDNYCSMWAANGVTDAIRELIGSYPDVNYVVIAGSHEIIPFRQVLEGPIAISPETDYVGSSGTDWPDPGIWPPLPDSRSPLYWSLQNGRIATDDFYVDDEPFEEVPYPYLGRELYVPDRPIGRLVEKPGDIIAVIDNFLTTGGVTEDPSCLVTAYEFLTDSGEAIDDTLQTFGLNTDALFDVWTAANLRNAWSRGPGLASLNAHFEHWRALPALGWQLFYSSELSDNSNVVAYSMGCHSGLNVPDGWIPDGQPDIGDGIRDDFPSVLASQGAAAWFANSGFAYGDDEIIADTELLMLYFTEELGIDGNSVGQAMIEAKQRFVSGLSATSLGIYPAKALMEAVLYGLPMHSVQVPNPQTPTASQFPVFQTSGRVSVLAHPDLYQGTQVSQTGPELLPAGVTYSPTITLTLGVDYSLTQVDTDRGSYFTTGGRKGVERYPGRPHQPSLSKKFDELGLDPVDDQRPHGAALVSATFVDYPDFDIVNSNPASDTTRLESDLGANGWFPASDGLWFVNTLGGSGKARLNVVLGQYTTQGRVERKYTQMVYKIFYADASVTDLQPPGIWPPRTTCDGDTVDFSVEVDDPDGILTVLLTYEVSGGWATMPLALAPHPDNNDNDLKHVLATGSIDLDPGVPFFLQAFDDNGNGNTDTNKGLHYTTCSDRPDAVNPVNTPHPILVKLEINRGDGWELVPDGTTFSAEILDVTDPGWVVPDNSCSDDGTSAGICTFYINSTVPGTAIATLDTKVDINIQIGDESLTTMLVNAVDPKRFVKEWWSGSVSFFKRVETTSNDEVCFILSSVDADYSEKKCHIFFTTEPYVYTWEALAPADDYRLQESETESGPFVMVPGIEDIIVDAANRNVLVRTLRNRLPGDQGCTPGYWKNHTDMWALNPATLFSDVFAPNNYYPASLTLEGAINLGGGGWQKLARHGLAAYLSARSAGIDYPYTPDQVLFYMNLSLTGTPDGLAPSPEPWATNFADANEGYCPLN